LPAIAGCDEQGTLELLGLQVLEGIAMPTRCRRTAPAALVAALVALTPWLAASATNTEPPQILVEAYNASGVDIFQRLASSPGNIAFSPLSIGTAMAMALAGARGDTQSEMTKVLRQKLAPSEIGPANAQLMATLDEETGAPNSTTKLTTANALILQQKGDLVAGDYRALLEKNYRAEVFAKPGLAAVNQWFEEKTDGKITNMLTSLDPNTAAVLASTIHFKALWSRGGFGRSLTADEPFSLTKKMKVQVPTMHRTGEFFVVARPGYRAIQLPYATPSLGMIVVLPNAPDGVDAVGRADFGEWAQLFAALREKVGDRFDVSLPRFKIQYDADLANSFQKAGMHLAFQSAADFSGMFQESEGKTAFALGTILHRATVDVNEDGTEAAAGTAVGMGKTAKLWRSPPKVFKVDHPFLFFIVDETTGAVLFQGRVSDPRAASTPPGTATEPQKSP
jgi:serpin B